MTLNQKFTDTKKRILKFQSNPSRFLTNYYSHNNFRNEINFLPRLPLQIDAAKNDKKGERGKEEGENTRKTRAKPVLLSIIQVSLRLLSELAPNKKTTTTTGYLHIFASSI